jgi:hypothetical protein
MSEGESRFVRLIREIRETDSVEGAAREIASLSGPEAARLTCDLCALLAPYLVGRLHAEIVAVASRSTGAQGPATDLTPLSPWTAVDAGPDKPDCQVVLDARGRVVARVWQDHSAVGCLPWRYQVFGLEPFAAPRAQMARAGATELLSGALSWLKGRPFPDDRA